MSQVTNRRYDHDALLRINCSYNEEHTLTPEDVDAVNNMVVQIESSRSETKPKPGDRVTFISRHGDYTTNALIEKVDEGGTSVCVNPYVPFVFPAQNGIHCDVSGGPFTGMVAKDAKYLGIITNQFKLIGHCGLCANCTIHFEANVSHWEYREPKPLYGNFTTKTHRRIYLYRSDDAVAKFKYEGEGLAFKDDEDLQQFLNTFKGTIFPGNWPNQIVVWCFHDKFQGISPDEWNTIDAPVTQRIIGCLSRDVKVQKDLENHAVITYFVRNQTC